MGGEGGIIFSINSLGDGRLLLSNWRRLQPRRAVSPGEIFTAFFIMHVSN